MTQRSWKCFQFPSLSLLHVTGMILHPGFQNNHQAHPMSSTVSGPRIIIYMFCAQPYLNVQSNINLISPYHHTLAWETKRYMICNRQKTDFYTSKNNPHSRGLHETLRHLCIWLQASRPDVSNTVKPSATSVSSSGTSPRIRHAQSLMSMKGNISNDSFTHLTTSESLTGDPSW